MSAKLIAACMLVAPLAAPIPVTAAEPPQDSTRTVQYVSDSPVTAAVKNRLKSGQFSGLTQLNVKTDRDGTVWLSCTTATQETADRAIEAARNTDGVVQVRSKIAVVRDTK